MCYSVEPNDFNQYDAMAKCVAQGARLINPADADEMTFASELIGQRKKFYLDLRDDLSEGKYISSTEWIKANQVVAQIVFPVA